MLHYYIYIKYLHILNMYIILHPFAHYGAKDGALGTPARNEYSCEVFPPRT